MGLLNTLHIATTTYIYYGPIDNHWTTLKPSGPIPSRPHATYVAIDQASAHAFSMLPQLVLYNIVPVTLCFMLAIT